ncbi:MAG TPA: beta-ketoacyl-ACP synthase III [Acidimicrobiales bacterium]|nr:beta-ketoacyl-ACP synthase III [Acidimicrobiales bacterium]
MGISIRGWGLALPEKIVTNDDLAQTLDTSDEWIRERTGIHERRIGGTTSGLATEAAQRAIEVADVDPSTIDMLVVATTSPDQQVPGTSATVQHALGLTCGAVDMNAACSGFVYGLTYAAGLAAIGAKRVLVVGAETLSRITDWDDRGTAILFADGAGAAVVDAVDGPGSLLGWDLGADGSLVHVLYADIGGYLQMNGKEVFRQAIKVMAESSKAALERAGLTPDDVDVVIPHQANTRIIEASMTRLGVPYEKAVITLHRTGNTSAASIPMALVEGIESGRVNEGDVVLLVGFGAGMTSASAVLRWGA